MKRAAFALSVLAICGCADLRYRSAMDDLHYDVHDAGVSCWTRGPPLSWPNCEDEAAAPDLQQCAASLAAERHSILVESIRRELRGCMAEKGWRLELETVILT